MRLGVIKDLCSLSWGGGGTEYIPNLLKNLKGVIVIFNNGNSKIIKYFLGKRKIMMALILTRTQESVFGSVS